MRKKILPLLLLFSLFAFSFADFIDYSTTDDLPRMREYLQGNDEYYVSEDVRYNLNLVLSLPTTEAYRYLGGTGSVANLEDGDMVCEGTFNYDLEMEAWALESGFSGYMYDFGAGSPATWPDCTSPSCPGDDARVYWSNSLYASYCQSMQTSSKHLQNYALRRMSYKELHDVTWSSNEQSEVSTVMRGTYSLTRGSTNIISPTAASGSVISDDDSFELTSNSRTEYTITERLDVTGALLGIYNPSVDGEYYNAFDGIYPNQDEYTKPNIHDDGKLIVYAEENVGISPPTNGFVDLYADGVFPPPGESEVITPGETIPVEIAVTIPAAPSNFYPLAFEFDSIRMSGPSGFSFTSTSLGTRCNAGGYRNGASSRTVYLQGTLTIPPNLAAGEYDLSFRAGWRSCSGEVDCNGNGYDSETPSVTVTVEVEEEGGNSDLVCTLEPASYSSASAVENGQILPGEGVESWRVTVTNIGEDPAVVSTSTQRACSAVVFEAMDNVGTTAPDPSPAYYAFVPESFPQTIDPGASRTITIPNTQNGAQVYCSEEGGGELSAYAEPNSFSTPLKYGGCAGNMIDEPQGNNRCEWEMECAPPSGAENCWCQVFPSYSHGRAGQEYDFVTNCPGGDCGDSVSWALTTSAAHAAIASSSPDGATVLLGPGISPGRVVTLQATMDLGCIEPTVCSSTITVEEGGENYCTVIPSAYPDASAGETYEFGIQCNGGAGCPPMVYWSITEGEHVGELVYSIPSTARVEVSEDAAAGDRVRITATTEFEPGVPTTCDGIITVTDSPLNCTCSPTYTNGEPGRQYVFDVFCGGASCTGGAVWDWAEPPPKPQGTRFVDVGTWGAIIEVGSNAMPDDEVHLRARMNSGDMTCYCHLYMEDGECEITPDSLVVGPGDRQTFDLTCDGGGCWTDVEWELSPEEGFGTIQSSSNRNAEVEFTGEGEVVLFARPNGYGVCTAVITVEDSTEDDVLDCWIIPPLQYGHPGSHHGFDLWCRYGNGNERECAGDWDITHGAEWVVGGTFSSGGDDHWFADLDLIVSLFGTGETVDIHATVQEDEDLPPAHCYAVIELPSMDCLDFI